MGKTHFDQIVGKTGVFVGAVGSEVQVSSTTGALYQSGTAVAADLTGASPVVYSVINSVSLAELNAGKTLLAAVAGRTVTVVDWSITAVGGNATAATAVTLSDTAGSPVLIATVAVAALTSGTVVKPNSSNVTDGAAGIGLGLTADKGITVEKTGSDMTTATDFTVTIQYTIA